MKAVIDGSPRIKKNHVMHKYMTTIRFWRYQRPLKMRFEYVCTCKRNRIRKQIRRASDTLSLPCTTLCHVMLTYSLG